MFVFSVPCYERSLKCVECYDIANIKIFGTPSPRPLVWHSQTLYTGNKTEVFSGGPLSVVSRSGIKLTEVVTLPYMIPVVKLDL